MKPLKLTLLMLVLLVTSVWAGPGDNFLKQAQDLRSKGDSQGALNAANAGLAVEPDNFKLNALVGDIYFNQARYDSSLAYFRKALQKKGKDPDALYGAGISALNIKSYDEAAKFFRDGEKTGKAKSKFYYGLGLVLMEQGDYANADLNFRKAIDKDKKNPLYHLALAEANFGSKTYIIAIAEFNKAIELDSSIYNREGVHYKMAQAHLNMRNVNAAIDEYKVNLQLHPTDTTAWMELARIYQISGNIREAIFCYEKFLNLVPNNGQAWFDEGKLYMQLPDQEKAASSFERAVQVGSNVAESYGYLARIYSDRKEYERALDAYNRYEAEFGPPDSVQYWFEKGRVLMKVGEKNASFFDSALIAFDKAISLDSTYAPAYEYAGLTLYYQKDYTRAINYFRRQLAIDSTSINTYRNLAFSYLKTEQYGPAAGAFRKAIDLKPDDVLMRSMLGKIYSFNQDFSNAVEQYEYILNSNPGPSDSLKCEIYPELGYDYLSLRQCQKAATVLLKAERCRPNDISVLLNIAASYHACNSLKEANAYYKKVLDRDPNNKQAKKGFLETKIQGQEG